jgi:SAM-dependent methyltransferase
MESWTADIDFERPGPLARAVKAGLVNPLVNYLVPADWLRWVLRFAKSELAASNWRDPGGWRSMVISYDGRPKQIADKLLVGAGGIPVALRNRRRLGARLIARLIDQAGHEPVHVLCLGAGPGRIIIDAMSQARADSEATLVDLNSDAFEYGRQIAAEAGVGDKVRYIQGDVRDVHEMLEYPPDVVKMLGICEYLSDEQIVSIAEAVADVMPIGKPIVFNSISRAHGTDSFFRRVFGLHMIHRSPRDLQRLMASAGFGNFVSLAEPTGVYHVIVGRRVTSGAL